MVCGVYAYIYVSVCVCCADSMLCVCERVCVVLCVRERETEV